MYIVYTRINQSAVTVAVMYIVYTRINQSAVTVALMYIVYTRINQSAVTVAVMYIQQHVVYIKATVNHFVTCDVKACYYI